MLYCVHWLQGEVEGMSREGHPLEESLEVHFDQLYRCMTLQLLFVQILCPMNAFEQILLHGHFQSVLRGWIDNLTEWVPGLISSGPVCMLLMRFLLGGLAFVVP